MQKQKLERQGLFKLEEAHDYIGCRYRQGVKKIHLWSAIEYQCIGGWESGLGVWKPVTRSIPRMFWCCKKLSMRVNPKTVRTDWGWVRDPEFNFDSVETALSKNRGGNF